MRNIFDKIGDKDITDLYNHIRVGMIQSVDIIKATVTIQWLDRSGARIEVPIPMPFCEQGWGIYAMPRRYSLVLCDVRTYEMPVILAYVPPNFMGDDKAWDTFKTISSFPTHQDGSAFDSGEIIIRNLIGKAKCKSCGVVSSLEAWAATYSYNDINAKIKMEICPNPSCNKPSFEMTPDGTITAVNKIQLGILIYLQRDGKLSIRLNDGLSQEDGDTFAKGSLIKIEFDEHSNVLIDGIQNMTLKSVNSTTNIQENEIVTSTDSHETTDHKLIESVNIELGDTSAITIGQAQKIITIVTRLMTELANHYHVSSAPGVNTGPMLVVPPLTIPQKSEIETIKTKAS